MIAERPDEGTLHEERAAVYGKLGREAERQAELARVFELGADQGIVIPQAEELGRAGRWAEAASLLARCGRTGPLSRELAQAWGIACLRAGDRAGYREACAAVLARQWPDPIVAWDATLAGSLLALGVQGLDDYRVPIAWFERRLADVPVPPPIYHPYYFPNALGGLLIRAGRIDEAITRLNEGTAAAKEAKFQDYPTDWAYLSLAHAPRETLQKPAVGSNASARSFLLRRSPSGISRSWPSSGARPNHCSSMPVFRVIRFRVGGRDEPPRRSASLAVPRRCVSGGHSRVSRRSRRRCQAAWRGCDRCRSLSPNSMTCSIDWPRSSRTASAAASTRAEGIHRPLPGAGRRDP